MVIQTNASVVRYVCLNTKPNSLDTSPIGTEKIIFSSLVRQDNRITQDKMNLLGYGLVPSDEELGGEFYHLDGSVADW